MNRSRNNRNDRKKKLGNRNANVDIKKTFSELMEGRIKDTK